MSDIEIDESEYDDLVRRYLQEQPIQLDDDFSNIVIVDGLPSVNAKKYPKLMKFLTKKFSAFGKIDGGIDMPMHETEGSSQSSGYAYIQYSTPEEAAACIHAMNGKKMDATYTFRVNAFGDFQSYERVPEDYEAPVKEQYESKANLTSWLLDSEGRDQFMMRHSSETEIWWNDPLRQANEGGRELCYGGEREKKNGKTWTERRAQWSGSGKYLATFHAQGIALWGGENFEKLQRFMHPNVKFVDFSPCENYLVTCNGEEAKRKGDPECIIVWDARTGQKKRGFDGGHFHVWPSFRWSHDDLYFGRCGKDRVSVYTTEGFGLIDKKSVRIPGVQEIRFSPSEYYISYSVPEKDNIPARVGLLQVPDKKQLRDKHLYNVKQKIEMRWHPKGIYLAVKLVRRKTKKTHTTNLEIFRLGGKDIPVEVLEFKSDEVVDFQWEPNGERLAVIHNVNGANVNDVSFYRMTRKGVKHIGTEKNRAANVLKWAPEGGSIVIAGLGPTWASRGQLEFFDCNLMMSHGEKEHFSCTDIAWDPSGRYCMTAVCQGFNVAEFRSRMDNGYKLWSHQGELLHQHMVDSLYQSQWRPRPPSLLTSEMKKEIAASLKEKYWAEFEAEDEKIRAAQLVGDERIRHEKQQFWKQYREQKYKEFEDEREERRDIRGGLSSDTEDDFVEIEYTVEVEVERTETILDA